MAISKHRPSSSTSSLYPSQAPSLTNEYINIAPSPFKEDTKNMMFAEEETVTSRTSINYLPPPFPPPGWDPKANAQQPFMKRHRKLIAVLLYILTLLLITAAFAAPVVYFKIHNEESEKLNKRGSKEKDAGSDKDKDGGKDKGQGKDLHYHFALWLLVSWGFLAVSNILINIVPYAFRIVASWVNPGWVKYWRIFRFMRLAVTLLGGVVGCYLSYVYLINNDKSLFEKSPKKPDSKSMDWDDILKNLAINANKKLKKPSEAEWNKILNDILTILIIWAVLFFFEKIAMLYISIHYHYRADGVRIEEAKCRRNVLVTLYDASISLYPAFHTSFRSEDSIIRDEAAGGKGAMKFLSKFKSAGSKVIVDHALESQRASAALAKRIWRSLVPEERNILTAHDIAEVLGTRRRAEAENAFKILDKNENGDITLSEMVLTVLETSRSRRMVYQGMTDINQAINTLDWICCVLILMTVTFFGIVRYIPSLAKLRDAAGFAALGLTWGVGRSIYEFINGCIFIFFKHAYDVGDRVELYNLSSTISTPVVVKRISILFTVFRRVDNGKDLQMSNDRLNLKRIENVTRSGANREQISVYVDFNSTFTDIQHLKSEIQAFLTNRVNSRDYQPGCEVLVGSIGDMNRMEIKVGFTHKSNWSNEELRAARSSKFTCALVAALRRIPLVRPGGLAPNYPPKPDVEHSAEEAAYRDLTLIPITSDDTSEENSAASGAEIKNWIGWESTGLRRRPDQAPGSLYYGT